MTQTQKYERMDQSFATAKNPLVAFDPYATTMTPIVQLAKAADVPFYAGYSGGPMFVELPFGETDQVAFFELANQLGLHRWTGQIASSKARIVQ